jgi:hypothetical protein
LESFPGRVIAQLKCRVRSASVEPRTGFGPFRSPFLVWSVRLAAVCILFGVAFVLWESNRATVTDRELAQARKYVLELRELFPGQLRAIAFEDSRPRLILAESPVVADTQPVYVSAHGKRGCQTFITFSGQQIRLDGHEYEVLANAHGGVMLISETGVFVSGGTTARIGGLRIEARELNHNT